MPATLYPPLVVPMRVNDHTPGTAPPSTATTAASRAALAAGSLSRRPLVSPPALQHREGIRQEHRRSVVLPAPPPPTLQVVQTRFVFEPLGTVLHPPTALGGPHQLPQRRGGRQVAEEV